MFWRKKAKLSESERKWNLMWDLWANGKVASPYAELMAYQAEVNNGGHSQYFFNTANCGDLGTSVDVLLEILPDPLRENLKWGYDAFSVMENISDDSNDELFNECDSVFYAHEQLVLDLLHGYADTLPPETSGAPTGLRCGFNAAHLRLLALFLMLLDHLWATVVPGNLWMTCVGRLAFPIFAFQAVEGYVHTRDYRKYCRRLLVFGLVSEIPFNLMLTGSPIFPFHQNVMFTLLFGLMAIHQLDLRSQADDRKAAFSRSVKFALILLLGVITFPDYGGLGVLTMVAFYVVRGSRYEKPLQLLAMIAINYYGFEGMTIPVLNGSWELPVQAFAILALIPIWLYNGEKGRGGKALQYASYLFYPLHMLILGLL